MTVASTLADELVAAALRDEQLDQLGKESPADETQQQASTNSP
jgi:hypothetical protein